MRNMEFKRVKFVGYTLNPKLHDVKKAEEHYRPLVNEKGALYSYNNSEDWSPAKLFLCFEAFDPTFEKTEITMGCLEYSHRGDKLVIRSAKKNEFRFQVI